MQKRRIGRHSAALLVIDIQERLLPAISNAESVLQNSIRLIRGAAFLGLKIFATEQYRKGLGATVPQVAEAIQNFAPIQKMAFSACGAPSIVQALQESGATDIILCGIEAHVCVCQTALDLLDSGLRVFVVADAIGSRTDENKSIGIERMRQAGALIVSTEMILFELLQEAGTDAFKEILRLVK